MEVAEAVSGDVIEREFNVGSGAEFNLNNVSGQISVRAGEPGIIRVRAVKHGSERARANTTVEFDVEGNRVFVRTRADAGDKRFGIRLGSSMASVEYDVVVPADTRVEVKGVSSPVDVAGVRAPATIKTVSGDISVREITGDVQLTTVSGGMRGILLDGEVSLHSTSGTATLENSRISGCNLHSVSGGFTLETPLVTGGRYHAHTVSGSLKLKVPTGTGATIQLKSVSGGVQVDGLDCQSIKTGPRHWHGRVGDGSATVEMHSVSGSIRVEGDGIERRDADSARPSPITHESRTEILRALQQGEIDVDEAMARLDAR